MILRNKNNLLTSDCSLSGNGNGIINHITAADTFLKALKDDGGLMASMMMFQQQEQQIVLQRSVCC
jgi:hypothetical protein